MIKLKKKRNSYAGSEEARDPSKNTEGRRSC